MDNMGSTNRNLVTMIRTMSSTPMNIVVVKATVHRMSIINSALDNMDCMSSMNNGINKISPV